MLGSWEMLASEIGHAIVVVILTDKEIRDTTDLEDAAKRAPAAPADR